METPKTLVLIECRNCNGTYFGGSQRLTLRPGNEKELPDEIAIIVRKVSKCTSCKEREDRTRGGKKQRYER
jgi:hypothetical protein